MPVSDKSSVSSSAVTVDPLLKDLTEKKQSFRRNVVSLAAELKEVRSRLATKEQSLVKETLTRQEAEIKTRNMEKEMNYLHKSLEEKNVQLQASTVSAEMFVKELDDLKIQLSATKATADASAISAQSAQLQCSTLVKDLEQKNSSIKEHDIRVNKLEEQLNLMQKDLQAKEFSQTQLKAEISGIEREIVQALAKAGGYNADCELRKILDDVSSRNLEKINKILSEKDDEIRKLRDEIRIMSAHWKLTMKEMEHQLEKHHRVDQELKKKVLKLEFCLQETRAQTRKLQRMGERRDKALNELKDQLSDEYRATPLSNDKNNFWENSGFKIVASMSMLILVMFSKR